MLRPQLRLLKRLKHHEIVEFIEQLRGLSDADKDLFGLTEGIELYLEHIEFQDRPLQGTETTEPELSISLGIHRLNCEIEEVQDKPQRIDLDIEASTSPERVRSISSLSSVTYHMTSVFEYIVCLVSVTETTLRNSAVVHLIVNLDHGDLLQEIGSSEPLVWHILRGDSVEAHWVEDLDYETIQDVTRGKKGIELGTRLSQDASSIDVNFINTHPC